MRKTGVAFLFCCGGKGTAEIYEGHHNDSLKAKQCWNLQCDLCCVLGGKHGILNTDIICIGGKEMKKLCTVI